MKRCGTGLAIGVCVLLIAPLAFAEEKGSEDPSVQLFLQTCAATYAHEHLVEIAVARFGLAEIKDADADQYLAGHSGRAWRGIIASHPYAVSLLSNGLCSVFVHEGEPAQIIAAVESWLPPASVAITVTKEPIPSPPNVTTMSYEMRGGKVQERWVISSSGDPASWIKAILSWSRL